MEKLNERLYSWASILEPQTRDQAYRTASLDIISPHVALMPDAHLGAGATVGSVIPTVRSIIPAAVGVDIGCGMIAVRTQWDADEFGAGRQLSPLREAIEKTVPTGNRGGANHEVYAAYTRERIAQLEDTPGIKRAREVAPAWYLQLGSLGGGNHFIEISVDEEQRVWAFLHSGSRGVGNKLAQRHIRVAKQQCKVRNVRLPDPDLAWLDEAEPEFWAYIEDLEWAQQFAYLNRAEMMDRVLECLAEFMGAAPERMDETNCHHNYSRQEEHFGQRVWLSRKGAILADKGTRGLIPGSMGTRSYVVKGKGCAMALNSAPHGAGRAYGRKAARAAFTFAELEAAMAGIEWRRTDAFLDEIPQAYKDIDVVMRDAAELVEVEHTLRQVLNVKGD